MSSREEVAAEVAARIAAADADRVDALAAFAAHRFWDYWIRRGEEALKRLEAAGEHTIAEAGSRGEGG